MGRKILLSVLAVLFLSAQADPFGTARARFLEAVASGDADPVLAELRVLGQFDRVETARLLVKHCLLHEDILVHREAMELLSRLKDDAARALVIKAARSAKAWELRATCVRVMAFYRGEYVFSKLKEALKDRKWQVRASAIRGLASLRRKDTIPVLIDHLEGEVGRLRSDLEWALKQLTGEDYPAEAAVWRGWWESLPADFKVPALAEVRERLGKGSTPQALHTAVRKGLYGPVYSENVAFLLDISGSMTVGAEGDGTKTRAAIAKHELARVLENQLTPSSYFNIIVFHENAVAFSSRLRKATTPHIKKALAFIKSVQAGGETNAYEALQQAFGDAKVDTIYFLSDGAPTVGEESIPDLIRMRIAEWNRDRRIIINCIGFFPGEARNQDKEQAREFLRRMAHENEGYYKEIY
ncbi:MAG: HEAT repeat domain-containing protein [Planctomycetota bacterium]